jgi:hypothetical protein
MHLVDIQGPEGAIATLQTGDGLIVKPSGAERVEPGRWRVGGYATEARIAELESMGLAVTVLLTDSERSARLRALQEPES